KDVCVLLFRGRTMNVSGQGRTGQAAVGDVERELITHECQVPQPVARRWYGGILPGAAERDFQIHRSDLSADFPGREERIVHVHISAPLHEERFVFVRQNNDSRKCTVRAPGPAVEWGEV